MKTRKWFSHTHTDTKILLFNFLFLVLSNPLQAISAVLCCFTHEISYYFRLKSEISNLFLTNQDKILFFFNFYAEQSYGEPKNHFPDFMNVSNSIHGLPQYLDFKFELNYCVLIPIVPFIYIIPTVVVMWKVFRGYMSQPSNLTKLTLDMHLFTLLMLYFLANITFFSLDFLRFNIPSSGLITSWCASLGAPNRGLLILVILSDYMNYSILLLPCLVSLIRLIVILFAYNQKKIRSFLMRYFILPVLVLLPLLCVTYMFPSMGYCRQLGPPFPFGSIDIFYTGGLLGIRTYTVRLALSFSCWTLSAILSSVMYFKLRTGLMHKASSHTRKLAKRAELSISVTLISAIAPLITNTIVSVTAIWTPDIMYYFTLLRLVGNDFETVMMPWTLFLTHPIFKEKREGLKKKKKSLNVVKVWRVSQRST
ncbi:CRE-SRU-33 protein [Caenorhabditis remanei]|uniref:CRE-SRU-33 protein n=1 Tax=Caenorhabditis remanei TaxID=31234 RepID=E3MHL2_CAERE|nr:CRE-SRU-33 protein [Caenorhabditis remanei]